MFGKVRNPTLATCKGEPGNVEYRSNALTTQPDRHMRKNMLHMKPLQVAPVRHPNPSYYC